MWFSQSESRKRFTSRRAKTRFYANVRWRTRAGARVPGRGSRLAAAPPSLRIRLRDGPKLLPEEPLFHARRAITQITRLCKTVSGKRRIRLACVGQTPQAGPTNGRTAVLGVVVAHRRMGWFKVICGCTGKISVIRFRLKGPIGVLVTGRLCVRTENY